MAAITVKGSDFDVTRRGNVTTVTDAEGFIVGWVERYPATVRNLKWGTDRTVTRHRARCADGFDFGGGYTTRKGALEVLAMRWANVRARVIGEPYVFRAESAPVGSCPVDTIPVPDTCGTCLGVDGDCVCEPVESDVFVPTPVDYDTPADEVYQLALNLPGVDARIEYPRTDTASVVIECEGLTVCVSPDGDDPDAGWGASFDATGFDPVPVPVSGSDGAARVVSVVRRFLGLDPSL